MTTSNVLNITNYPNPILTDELMAPFSSLRLGGPADFYTRPRTTEELQILITYCRDKDLPFMILGGGANILVADRGIRGMVIHTVDMNQIHQKENLLIIQSGCDVSAACEWALDHKLSGLEWIYRMPGSIGGALWMNARCYGSEIAEILEWTEVLNQKGERIRRHFRKEEWRYKKSPFQNNGDIILQGAFRVTPGDQEKIEEAMKEVADDRINKGHFKKPSAGSTFKNDRNFGAPSGQIIDRCGLRGLTVGDAAVSPWHANILINQGKASSRDFLNLMQKVQEEVKKQTGFELEPEVLCIGDWRES